MLATNLRLRRGDGVKARARFVKAKGNSASGLKDPGKLGWLCYCEGPT